MEFEKQKLLDQGFVEQLLSIQERVIFLEKSKLCSGLTYEQLQTLAQYLDAYMASEGSFVCHEGDLSNFMCLVCTGRIAVVKNDLKNNLKTIATVGPGQSIGEMSIVDGGPRSASLQVQTPALLLVLNIERLNQMKEDVPKLWGEVLLQLARMLSKRLRLTSGVLTEYLQT